MGETLFQIVLALAGIVVGIFSQSVRPGLQKWLLLIFGLLLFLSAGLWWGYNLATDELTTAPATAETFGLAGVWEGTNSSGVVFRFTFASECNVGDACGKVELPTVGCTAIPVLVSSDGVTYEFDETQHQNCGPDTANDVIKIVDDETLLFGGVGEPPTVTLYRK